MRTLRHVVDERAEQHPQKIFLIAPEPRLELTYGRLRRDSITFGKRLLEIGLAKGDKLSYMMGNGYQTVKIFLGAMYSGFTVAPLNLLAQPSQLAYVLDHSDTKLVFFTEDHKEKLEAAVSKINRGIQLVPVDNDSEMIFPETQDRMDLSLPDVAEDDDALLLYTSGTTGLPKGVVLSHKNLLAGGRFTMMAHALGPDDRALCSLPVYHINGAVVTVIAPLLSRGTVVMPHRFSVSNFWEQLSQYNCTWFSVVPTIISYLLNSTDLAGKNLDLSRVRFGRSASSALPPALHKAFEEKFNISIIETMGLTETAAPIFSNPLDPAKRKYGSPGCAVGNEAKIVDREGNEVPYGTQGEIVVRGENVMKQYYKAPDITAKAIEPDGWLHTGDIGYMDADGFVFVTGRIKELIIKGGENIAPREIDEALYCHPAVLDCAAVGIPDDHYGEEIMCCVVLKPGCHATEQELQNHCRELLGKFKTPKLIRLLEELPKGPSGKIQRMKLREML
ncbi:MAG: long-chain fatty acid--CoA ligase [Candidatus Abyssobacteria bacterium SURF_5]|uniref:Long-chain fatty acid--CoA ligase n=1 Tax=Abyssobacteria bacterium (strain SURF_5) TaxID=2093360 RepID=A0A3A4NZ66_ABYX5|nr:MAG: long-chain fatty acid--CoA ligase [Candidatus Abyssubacteria bacterium SURF_5]